MPEHQEHTITKATFELPSDISVESVTGSLWNFQPAVESAAPAGGGPPRATVGRGNAEPLLKQLRQALGPMPASGSNGAFTEAAVREGQRSRGLLPDGIVGPKSSAMLDADAGFGHVAIETGSLVTQMCITHLCINGSLRQQMSHVTRKSLRSYRATAGLGGLAARALAKRTPLARLSRTRRVWRQPALRRVTACPKRVPKVIRQLTMVACKRPEAPAPSD